MELLMPFVLLFLTNLLTSAKIQSMCDSSSTYTCNSTYSRNLQALLSSLSTNVDDNGFYNASAGQSPHTVYASVLCRGDIQLHACRDCIRDVAADILEDCPQYQNALQLDEFCVLRYSNKSMFGIVETCPAFSMWNSHAAFPDSFQRDVLNVLLRNLQDRAASGGSRWKVAYGNTTTVDSRTIFSLVQCTPDLSSENCSSCLVDVIVNIMNDCGKSRGCRSYLPSCNIRYEVYPFYNDTRLQELQAAITEATPLIIPSTMPPQPPPSPPLPPPGKEDANTSRAMIVVILVPIAACLILAACSGVLLTKWMKKKSKEELQDVLEISVSAESLQYDFDEIRAATSDFSDAKKLGQGGFGNVYKGNLADGQEVAVKRLSWDSKQGDMEFKNEVSLMARLQHRNLVRLLGFSIQGKEKLLVYEFVTNGSLDRLIFDPIKRSDLGCDQCYKIIVGIAKGLVYLHEESRLKIIHRDLKASNILLDGDMNPKIADFGLARLFLSDETEGNTSKIVGTYGYMAPEYAMHGEFSVKSDVFSFGVLVLETIWGQKNNSIRSGDNIENLLSWAWKNWRKGTTADTIDPALRNSCVTLNDMLRCIHIGLLCVQENPAYRPTMAVVVQMISNSHFSLPMPSQPAFFVPSTSYELDNEQVLFREYTSRDFESSKSYSDATKEDRPTNSSKMIFQLLSYIHSNLDDHYQIRIGTGIITHAMDLNDTSSLPLRKHEILFLFSPKSCGVHCNITLQQRICKIYEGYE